METVKFMYFLMNYSQEQLKGFFNATSAPRHIEEKFCSYIKAYNLNGSEALIKLFYELDRGNQLAVVEYVNNNYNGIR